MKMRKYSLAICKQIILLVGILVITSCGSKEYEKIPLENLDPKLKKTGSIIAKDILTSINHEDGARYLTKKEYITPMVHGRIMKFSKMYEESYQMAPVLIGKVSKYKLFQVLDKGIVKTLRYKLETDKEDMEFIELKIDINREYGLADFYIYVTSKDGILKRENILPAARK